MKPWVTFERIDVADCEEYGLRAHPQADDFTARGNRVKNCGKTGILTGGGERQIVEDNDISGIGKEWCWYISQGGSGHRVRNNRCRNAARGGQINAETERGGINPSLHCEVSGNQFTNVGGGAAINLIGVCRSVISGNVVEDATARFALSFWDLDRGPQYACRDNQVSGNTFELRRGHGEAVVKVSRNCTGNRFRKNRMSWTPKQGAPALAIIAEAPISEEDNTLNGKFYLHRNPEVAE
jgi:hypothetical protein